jgi:hypothetical protein
VPGLLAAQRDRGAEDAKFERIAAERSPNERELGAFDQAQDHESLYRGVVRSDALDRDLIPRFEIRQRHLAPPP